MTDYRFGPGSLESITLRTRTRRRGWTRPAARIIGTFRVYCGWGGEHTVDVSDAYEDLIASPHEMPPDLSDETVRDRIARERIEWSLEGWYDPCD